MFPRAASNPAAQDDRSVSQTFDRALVVQQLIEGEQSRGRNQGSRPYGLQWPHQSQQLSATRWPAASVHTPGWGWGWELRPRMEINNGLASSPKWRRVSVGTLNSCRLPWLLRTSLHGAIAIYIDTGRVRCFSCHLMVPLPTAVCPLPPCNRCCATRAVEREEGAANWRDWNWGGRTVASLERGQRRAAEPVGDNDTRAPVCACSWNVGRVLKRMSLSDGRFNLAGDPTVDIWRWRGSIILHGLNPAFDS